jgi:hypothetical protein
MGAKEAGRASGATGYLPRERWAGFLLLEKERGWKPEGALNGARKGKPGALDTVPGPPEGPLAKGNVFSRTVYHPPGAFLTEVGRSGGRR